MHPTALMLRVHLSPDVILGVPHPSYTSTKGSAEHAKAVGPFTGTSSSSLQQLPHIRVAGESFVGTTHSFRASVQFDTSCTACGLIGRRGSHSLGDRGRAASSAGRVIDELKEAILEPPISRSVSKAQKTIHYFDKRTHLRSARMTQSWYPHSGFPPTLAA